jgi:hypothetical protein
VKANLLHQTFGRLRVAEDVGSSANGHGMWRCERECGRETVVLATNLKSGHTQSCGCFMVEQTQAANTKHGDIGSPEYDTYRKIIQRCTNPANPSYPDYGARGISVCEEWLGPSGYDRFLVNMGRKPTADSTIERQDNERGYTPDNCIWADRQVQANNRRTNRIVEYRGQRMTLAQAARAAGVRYGTVVQRVNVYGWSVERALAGAVNG